ncbi:MAG TPA: alpha/beta hydrolase [Ramlibacter sp.]|uniref:alpha/beta fold hydrolase n=1 Tax=Ramlibacter sp. TaxID=1917967 RepID=UPI002C7D5AE1|nr:alpha/beta hydrolase [Ramlibacter sp.]HVZ43158.1 alpha/beta hydrolase [Ramlibacter sp.]
MADPKLNYVSCPDKGPGHRMAYWEWGDPRAGHVVLCVHGLFRQGRDFDTLAQALVERSCGKVRVVCPDVVGRGKSDWLADPAGYEIPTYVMDTLQLLGQLHAQSPIEKLDWVGTSMGGLIGMAVCGTPNLPLPAAVRRLVLNDVGPVVQWAFVARLQSYAGQVGHFQSEEEAADAMWAISHTFGPHTREQWLALSRPMLRPHEDGGWKLHYDPAVAVPIKALTPETAAQGQATIWGLYDNIRARTLLTRGAQSDLLARETAMEMTCRGPKAEVVEFEGVGHAPTLVAPDQVEAVASFLLAPDSPADEKPPGGTG